MAMVTSMEPSFRLAQIPENTATRATGTTPLMLPSASICQAVEYELPSPAEAAGYQSGDQSPMDRFYNPAMGCQSPSTQFFEGGQQPVFFAGPVMMSPVPVVYNSAGYYTQPGPGMGIVPQMWAPVPSGASAPQMTWDFAPAQDTMAPPNVEGPPSAISLAAPADASCQGAMRVPKAVFVDLSCLRERTLQGRPSQLPVAAAAAVQPTKKGRAWGQKV